MLALEVGDTTVPSALWSMPHQTEGWWEERSEWGGGMPCGKERRGEGVLSNSPLVSKQSAEHLAVFHAAERTHAKSPLLPLSLPPFLFSLCVNKGKSLLKLPPAPESTFKRGGCRKSTLTYHNS